MEQEKEQRREMSLPVGLSMLATIAELDSAIYASDLKTVMEILGKCPDILKCGTTTPLQKAVMYGKDAIVDAILGIPLGVQTVTMINMEGNTAFHIAVKKRNYEVCKKLLEINNSVILVSDKDGNTPLHSATDNTKMLSLFFIRKNAEFSKHVVHMRNKNGQTPIDLACRYRNRAGSLLLLKYGSKLPSEKEYIERLDIYAKEYKRMRTIVKFLG